tara:strand:- start:291 stop:449 length:159 start_codon:yes stop_codon:yes gene_type:complete
MVKVSDNLKKRFKKKPKSRYVGKHPLTGEPETQEDRDNRLRSVGYPTTTKDT